MTSLDELHAMPGIYFIQRMNYVKIGFSARPRRRLQQLQTHTERRLFLLHTIPVPDAAARREHEKQVHAKFADAKVHGEWFWYGRLSDYIFTLCQVECWPASRPKPIYTRQGRDIREDMLANYRRKLISLEAYWASTGADH